MRGPLAGAGAALGGLRVSVVLLTIAAIFSNADRSVLGILMEPIKHDLALSDTQLGLLSGLTFAAFYAILGLPFARWADVGNRRTIMALSFGIWSVMTALCGAASTFTQMFLARIGVGAGEAGGTPTSHSLVADYWPAARRATGAAVLTIGGTLGSMVGFVLGGQLAETIGWRGVFVAFGVPGIVFAILVAIWLKEPRTAPRLPTFSELLGKESLAVARSLLGRRSFSHLIVGYTVFFIISSGAGQFFAPFMMRSFALSIGEVGVILGLMSTVPLVIGTLVGGWLCNRLAARNIKWLVWLPAICIGTNVIFYSAGVLAPTWPVFVAFAVTALLFVGISGPCIYAAIYGVVGQRHRATGVAIMGLFVNFIGTGLGPIGIGLLSDHLTPALHNEALRYSLLSLGLIKIWSVCHFLLAAKALPDDLDNADRVIATS